MWWVIEADVRSMWRRRSTLRTPPVDFEGASLCRRALHLRLRRCFNLSRTEFVERLVAHVAASERAGVAGLIRNVEEAAAE